MKNKIITPSGKSALVTVFYWIIFCILLYCNFIPQERSSIYWAIGIWCLGFIIWIVVGGMREPKGKLYTISRRIGKKR